MFGAQKQQRDMADPLLDPGMQEMLILERKVHLMVRLQHPSVLSEAFNAYVASKVDKQGKSKGGQNTKITDFHALRLLQTFDKIEKNTFDKPDGPDWWINPTQLLMTLGALASTHPQMLGRTHVELARRVFEKMPDVAAAHEESPGQLKRAGSHALVTLLAGAGQTTQARSMVLEKLDADTIELAQTKDGATARQKLWEALVNGFILEDAEQDLAQVMQAMDERGIARSMRLRIKLSRYYLEKGKVEDVQRWFDFQLPRLAKASSFRGALAASLYADILKFALRNDSLEWAERLFSSTDKRWHQAGMVLAAASMGKAVDEIDVMLRVMAQREGPQSIDIVLFNSLISFAASQKDPYKAERYMVLAHKWNVAPDAQTHILQTQYRLDMGDLPGALEAYNQLRAQPDSATKEEFDLINRLVQALVTDPRAPKHVVSGLLSDLAERKKTFPAATVRALTLWHLGRDEYFEVVDLLQTYAFKYSVAERAALLDAMSSFALAPEQDTARTWDAYMIFHQVFDLETSRALRQAVMERMFAANRADLAIHVFTRMSKHARPDARPDADTYAAALGGIARTKHADALEVVHNLLKLDTDVEPTTAVRTGLMLAYTAIGVPVRALELWADIALSPEGPSRASLHAALRACEVSPYGAGAAREVWARIRQADVPLDEELLASYVSALVGAREVDEALQVASTCVDLTGKPPGGRLVASMFVAAQDADEQDGIAAWASEMVPDAWAQVEGMGVEEVEDEESVLFGMRIVRGLDRSVDPRA